MVEIKRYTESHRNEWDTAVRESKNGNFLFLRDYLNYHKERFKDHSLIITQKNKIVALFPANEQNNKICSHGGLTFGSLILSRSIKTADVHKVLLFILEYYKKIGFEEIIYKPIPPVYHRYPSEEDLYALYRTDARLVGRGIASVIKINDQIKFSQTKRQAVKKCQGEGIVVVESHDFEEYWNLLTNVLSKFDTRPVHSLQEIEYLHKSFPHNIRLFEARRNKELLAGVVIYDYDHVVHTQYMANSEEGRKIGALDCINYFLLKEIFNNRQYYSFGTSTEQQGKILNEGLVQQKEMMGGRGIVLDTYSISLN